MRIWHVYASNRLSPINGVAQAIHQLAEAQRSIGMEVSVLHGTNDDPRRGLGSATGRGLSDQAQTLAEAEPPDLIHLHELFRPPHLRLRELLAMTPFVVSTHGATAPQNLQRYRWRKATYGQLVERRVLRRASGLVALTAVEADDIRRWLPDGPPISVIANVADPNLASATPWRPHGPGAPIDVVSLARWDVHHKGLDRLAELAAAVPKASFTVHGDRCGNEPERLEELIDQAPVNLSLAPAVHGVSKEARLRSASAFILLSRWEGLSMALLEAMALAMPCLVSPEVAETLGGDPPVIVVPNGPRGAEVVRTALADPTRLAVIGARGRHWVHTNASAGQVAGATDVLYRRLAPVARRAVPVGA